METHFSYHSQPISNQCTTTANPFPTTVMQTCCLIMCLHMLLLFAGTEYYLRAAYRRCGASVYRRGAVVCKDSTNSDWIYIIKSGSCWVLRQLLQPGNHHHHHNNNYSCLPIQSVNHRKQQLFPSLNTNERKCNMSVFQRKSNVTSHVTRSLTCLSPHDEALRELHHCTL